MVIAEGDKEVVEKFASAIWIENSLINVETVDANYSNASGEFSLFRKVAGPDEVGERLDEGIEILKDMLTGVNNLTMITQSGFEGLNSKMDGANCRMDTMLDKQDETTGEIKGLRRDLKDHMDQRFESIESWPRSKLRCELRA
ncbi:MAG TPA: hypothetical protein VF300_01075 [Methanothrix sp.]